MLANFTSQRSSSHTYDDRIDTRVENVSSSALMKIMNSAWESAMLSGVTPGERAVVRDRMDHRPVQREELHGVSLERELVKDSRPSSVLVLEANQADARLHVAELARLQVHDAEHEPAPALIRRDDRGIAESDAHARSRQPRDEQPEDDDERHRSHERLEVGEPVRRRTVGVDRPRTRGREHADAVRERLEKWVRDAHRLRARERAIAQRHIGEREAPVDEQQHAHHPEEEHRPAGVERCEIESREALRAESVLLAVRSAIAVQKAPAHGLRDDGAEAKVGRVGERRRIVVEGGS